MTKTPAKTAGHTVAVKKPVVKKKKKKLPLCPLKKPKAKYRIVKGKRVKVKPAKCRPRPKAKTKAKVTTQGKGDREVLVTREGASDHVRTIGAWRSFRDGSCATPATRSS